MSTYWGFACVSHDPPLVSEHWFNHGEDVLRDAFIRFRSPEGWPIDQRPEVNLLDLPVPIAFPNWSGYVTSEPIHWLREHPHCDVVLHNEYGDTQIIGETVSGSLGPRALSSHVTLGRGQDEH